MPTVLNQLQQALPQGAAALLITETSRRYVTGFASSLGYIFVTKGQVTALFDSRYIEAATAGVAPGITVQLLKSLKGQGSRLLQGATALYTEVGITVAQLNALGGLFNLPVKGAAWVDSLIAKARAQKTAWELEQIVKAQRFAEQALEQVLGFIKPGVTERQIAAELEYRMKLCGSDDMSFETIAVTGKKTSLPHGVPGDETVQKGDFITMDFGATCNGYHSDMTRTVAVGAPTAKMRKVYETVLAANLAAEEKAAAGVACSEVDAAARLVIEKAGYGSCFGHSTGHGVGLEIHEAPTVGPKNSEPLCPGQVITAEPGIYLPGEFGVRIEDMLFITKNGAKNLTNTKKSLIIL